ncbi:hypothetical protein [Desulfovibrio sp. ZJ200]|uniref:hypothetical protein n=1 Tax=Desulfovibrio sp. ZJ200 TaxID=2709792 RepID=UPI001F15269F|nr:hypothetical protein [Desulfovibrio sp. ZJ200]
MPADFGRKITGQKGLLMIRVGVQAQGYGYGYSPAGGQQFRNMGKMFVQRGIGQMLQILSGQNGIKALIRFIFQKIQTQQLYSLPRVWIGTFQVFPRPGDGLCIKVKARHRKALMPQQPGNQPLRATYIQDPACCLIAEPVGAAACGFLAVFVEPLAQINFKAAIHTVVSSFAKNDCYDITILHE